MSSNNLNTCLNCKFFLNEFISRSLHGYGYCDSVMNLRVNAKKVKYAEVERLVVNIDAPACEYWKEKKR